VSSGHGIDIEVGIELGTGDGGESNIGVGDGE
jgi:hypothetical protein